MRKGFFTGGQRGATLVEFAIGGAVFLTAMFGILELGRLLWTHNALADATRRGARYAAIHPASSIEDVKRVVVCGTEEACAQSVISGLATTNVSVTYSSPYFSNVGSVTVKINPAYQFQFMVPLIGATLNMPSYSTTLPAESAGQVPAAIP